ncbi:hypothetical protein SAMN04488034_101814 [Salinimicrobium catena]|uniref:Uncharacterized protein n=2 Tax=Salinimicrobium catena TaxID=390640 RepID=A0A1H5JQ49_9FLAO|nr:hypothetical protein SAMN04488140_101800 [Salinimicrobium catena]SEE54560.1 hypothetical protein SAMN04488034_101814 [Salinimicrobium catena]
MFALLVVATLFFTSCRETVREERVVREVEEVEVEKETEDREGILERTAKEVDKEVNEEVNEEIEKIGDDN